MAKLKTMQISVGRHDKNNEFGFKYDVYVDQDGEFTTTIPVEIADLFQTAKIPMQRNKLNRLGFFRAKSLEALNDQIKAASNEYISEELISETIVIQYTIMTDCSYCLDKDGDIVPNGRWAGPDFEWQQGTRPHSATDKHPFGMQVYAKPFRKKTFRFKSGKTVIRYEQMYVVDHTKDDGNNYYLRWLEGIASIAPIGTPKEIEYTESIAKVFVDMIKGICKINERISALVDPEIVRAVSNGKFKLLG